MNARNQVLHVTSVTEPTSTQAVRRAAVRATLAPSIHNTQPWRFVLGGHGLDVHADWTRRLRVLDARGRQLLMSCGCAVFNARVGLAAAGYAATVDRFPDPARPELVARLTVSGPRLDFVPIAALDPAIDRRHTNRRRFSDEPVPADVVAALVQAANQEGTEALAISGTKSRQTVARLSREADDLENADPAYRAELRAWTSDDWSRRDGVHSEVVPPSSVQAQDLPIRDFDTHGMAGLYTDARTGIDQCLLLLGTGHDTPAAWLRAGEALERVLLEITRRGYVASPLTQVIEVAETNRLLRQELQLSMYPQVVLRVGRAPITPASRRRRLVDVFDASSAATDLADPRRR